MLFADEVDHVTLQPRSDDARKRVLIFFIPGNPGLVEYYRHFLTLIRDRLNLLALHTNTQYYISGGSLAGFDVNSGSRLTPATAHDLPLSLDDQVEDVYARLQITVSRIRQENGIEGDLPVVVIGHSIGAYIVLETVAKWRKMAQQGPTNMKLSKGLCLFPTIYELALSPTGRQVGPLTKVPGFALIVHTIAKILFYFAPTTIVTLLVQLIARMPKAGARVTAEFLQSKYGVWQALHMAKDELAQLTHDKWSDEFWGTSSTLSSVAKEAAGDKASSAQVQHSETSKSSLYTQLYFYWGSDDHWIAQDTRDKIIATRARKNDRTGDEYKPVMEVDACGIGHAFCLSEDGNEVVAAKCVEWITDLTCY